MPLSRLKRAHSSTWKTLLDSVSSRRHVSFTSAITKGIREGTHSSHRLGTSHTPRRDTDSTHGATTFAKKPRTRYELDRLAQASTKSPSRLRREQRLQAQASVSEAAPMATPYTTAGSEFLYGKFAVKAALEANRRRMYKLYIWKGERSDEDQYDHSIYHLAKSRRVRVESVAGNWDKMLLKMSNQRPHNGYVLEASTIAKLPTVSLLKMQDISEQLAVQPAKQTLEDQAANSVFEVSGGKAIVPRNGEKTRYPLLLWLDRITDTGNLGAIMRTAWFMGVDAIAIPEHGTAPLSPVTVKASAGAAELLPILLVKHETDFIRTSQDNGWKFIAAVSPNSLSTLQLSKTTMPDRSQPLDFDERRILNQAPCVLMLGNEGTGLRARMQQAADHFVSIHGTRSSTDGVESLNVSVAAALLTARLLSAANIPRSTSGSQPITEDASKPEVASEGLF